MLAGQGRAGREEWRRRCCLGLGPGPGWWQTWTNITELVSAIVGDGPASQLSPPCLPLLLGNVLLAASPHVGWALGWAVTLLPRRVLLLRLTASPAHSVRGSNSPSPPLSPPLLYLLAMMLRGWAGWLAVVHESTWRPSAVGRFRVRPPHLVTLMFLWSVLGICRCGFLLGTSWKRPWSVFGVSWARRRGESLQVSHCSVLSCPSCWEHPFSL